MMKIKLIAHLVGATNLVFDRQSGVLVVYMVWIRNIAGKLTPFRMPIALLMVGHWGNDKYLI